MWRNEHTYYDPMFYADTSYLLSESGDLCLTYWEMFFAESEDQAPQVQPEPPQVQPELPQAQPKPLQVKSEPPLKSKLLVDSWAEFCRTERPTKAAIEIEMDQLRSGRKAG
ncbi:MAG: hypothetical protein ABSF18_03085 [Gammaproteobacteria bacterium]|jgi:hypothetical protein